MKQSFIGVLDLNHLLGGGLLVATILVWVVAKSQSLVLTTDIFDRLVLGQLEYVPGRAHDAADAADARTVEMEGTKD